MDTFVYIGQKKSTPKGADWIGFKANLFNITHIVTPFF